MQENVKVLPGFELLSESLHMATVCRGRLAKPACPDKTRQEKTSQENTCNENISLYRSLFFLFCGQCQ